MIGWFSSCPLLFLVDFVDSFHICVYLRFKGFFLIRAIGVIRGRISFLLPVLFSVVSVRSVVRKVFFLHSMEQWIPAPSTEFILSLVEGLRTGCAGMTKRAHGPPIKSGAGSSRPYRIPLAPFSKGGINLCPSELIPRPSRRTASADNMSLIALFV